MDKKWRGCQYEGAAFKKTPLMFYEFKTQDKVPGATMISNSWLGKDCRRTNTSSKGTNFSGLGVIVYSQRQLGLESLESGHLKLKNDFRVHVEGHDFHKSQDHQLLLSLKPSKLDEWGSSKHRIAAPGAALR